MPEYKQNFPPENQEDFDTIEEKTLSKSQKLLVAVLAFFAVLIVVFQFFNLANSLNKPFAANPVSEPKKSVDELCPNGQCGTDPEYLRQLDTDQDGLSDYEELNIHFTSPYLADSDSDGYSDKHEVDSGKDPNCPAGQDCYGETASSPDQPISGALQETDASDEPSQAQAAQIREFLVANGMDEALLNNFSDQELVELYEENLSL